MTNNVKNTFNRIGSVLVKKGITKYHNITNNFKTTLGHIGESLLGDKGIADKDTRFLARAALFMTAFDVGCIIGMFSGDAITFKSVGYATLFTYLSLDILSSAQQNYKQNLIQHGFKIKHKEQSETSEPTELHA